MICQICNFQGEGKKFSNHLQSFHKISSKQYTIDYLLGGNQPKCEVCNGETRYVAFSFKRFCKACSRKGSSIAGKEGGSAPAWNKGKTKKHKVLENKLFKIYGCGSNIFIKNF